MTDSHKPTPPTTEATTEKQSQPDEVSISWGIILAISAGVSLFALLFFLLF